MNLLLISPDFNYSCGVSKHVYLLLKELKKNNNYNLFFITNKGDSLDRLTSLGIRPTIVDFSRGSRNIYKLIKHIMFLYKFCKQNNINVIHTHHRYPEFVAYLVSKILQIKTVSTVHSLLANLKPLSFKSEKVIAVSNAVKENLIDNYKIDANRIVVINNYVEPFADVNQEQKEAFLLKHNITKEDSILLFVGRINLIKGCDVLIHAFCQLIKLRKTVKLFLVGDFDLPMEFEEILKNNPSIFCINPTKDVDIYYSMAEIVVLPSRIDPFPFVMLEAGLAKKPFIGGRTGGIAEFIKDGVDSLLVNPGDSHDLLEKIIFFLDHKNVAKTMADNFYIKVTSLASMQQTIQLYEEFIQ